MKYYYTDAQNKPTGPVEVEQLKQLHSQGTLTPLSSVIPEGATQWTTLGAVLGIAPPPPAPPPQPATASVNFIELIGTSLGRFVETLLEFMRKVLTESFLTSALTALTRSGHALVLLGAVLGLVYSIVLAVRASTNSFGVFGVGLGLILWVAILQYAALRFFTANKGLVKSSPSRVGSAALLDCLALILMVSAVVALVSGTVTAIRYDQFSAFAGGLLSAVMLLMGAGAALHPKLSNVRIEESTAGQEAIGLASFFGKAFLKLLPLFFALASLAGTTVIIVAFFSSDSNSGAAAFIQSVAALIPGIAQLPNIDAGLAGVVLLVQACLLPVFAYLGFLVLYLALDLMRAVLDIPGKLDRLAR
jgi:hypothetical protein